jgi:pentatricopeptide repeat protein
MNGLTYVFNSGFEPDAATYFSMLSACVTTQQVEATEQILDHIINKINIKPNITLFNRAIGLLFSNYRMDVAIRCVETAMQFDNIKQKPNAETFHLLIDHFGRQAYLDRMVLVLDDMERLNIKPDVLTYNTMLHWICKHRGSNEAMEKYRHFCNIGFVANEQTYRILLNSFMKDKKYEEMLEVMRQMKRTSFEPSSTAFAAALEYYTKNNRNVEIVTVIFITFCILCRLFIFIKSCNCLI